ncbi:MAG: endolytic transglycosylase MltG [Epsilonproteobacteria bacterium]|nr:endolytic transglycosylase MltG [Campylobacterota bacterium]
MKSSQFVHKVVSTILTLIVIVIVSLVFYTTIPLKVPTKTVKLPKGSVTNTIKYLQKRGYKLSAIDKYLLVAIGQPKSGELNIGKGEINRIDFLHKLTSATEAFNIITLIPGETKEIFLQNISKKYKLNYKELEKSYSKYSSYPEAGIIPDTYHIPKGIKEDKLISFLVKLSEKKYNKLAQKELKKYDKKEWLHYLIIASIIQKEAANKQEMPKISSVIYNRLKKDMPLQMDGTLNYGKYSHIKVTPKRIKNDKSKFNTYLNKGLPPYPVCSVSIEAIKSAIHPDKSEYLFFMKNKNGVHDFSKTYQEHLKNVNRAKSSH